MGVSLGGWRNGVAFVMAAASVVVFWSSRAEKRAIDGRVRQLASARPFLLPGLTFPLRRYAPQLVDSMPQLPVLLLVSSDTCRFTAQELPRWKSLAERLGDVKVRIVTLSLSGDRLHSDVRAALAPLGIVPDTATVREPAQFRAESGVVSTPATFVLDEQGAIVTYVPRLTDNSIAHVTSVLSSPSAGAQRASPPRQGG
jgi:hypothetical protein